MEAQAMQVVLCAAGLLLLIISIRATHLLQESEGYVPPKLPEQGSAMQARRDVKANYITFYTAPAPFEGLEGARQTLAVHSWLRQVPCPKVVLMGQHPSLKSFAQMLEPHVSVDPSIDITFMGSPMFHSMISRAQAATSELIVLIDPSLVLLQDFTIAITKMRVIQSAWLLVAKPTSMTLFPYNLQGPSQLWVRGDGQDADDNEVRQSVKKKGIVTKCDGPGLWIWNKADVPLHAGIVPPFVYGSGHHSGWLLTEALASKYRALVDGSEAITLISPHQVSSRHYNGDGVQGRPWDVAGNKVLAMEYGSLYYRPTDLSNVTMKLVKCGEPSREGLCLSDTSDLLEACTLKNRKLRLVQKSKVQRNHGWLSLRQWFGPGSTFGEVQAIDCKTLALAAEKNLPCPGMQKKDVKVSELWLPFSLEALVARVASPDKVVVLSVAGNSYRAMLMSWVCSLRRLNVSNFLVYALDDEVYQYAVTQGVPVVKTSQNVNHSRDDCHFGTECFQKVTKMKSRTVLHLLKLGFKVMFSDVDVYWFQNPIPEMMSYGPGTLVAQTDQYNDTEVGAELKCTGKTHLHYSILLLTQPLVTNFAEAANLPRRLNSGFYFAWPDRATVAVFEKIVTHALTSEMSEQPSFYDTMCGIDGEYRVGDDKCVEPNTNVTAIFLDRRLYPNGASGDHWEKENVRESCEKQDCRVLHNNWVSGRERKLKRQVAAGLWDYDEEKRLCVTERQPRPQVQWVV